MATKKGVWNIQQVRDKQLQSLWSYAGGINETYEDARGSGGELWVTGSNSYGELGQNNLVKYSSPVQIPGTTWILAQTYGETSNVLVCKTDGTMWGWGKNNKGGIAINEAESAARSSPVQIPGTTWLRPSLGQQGISHMTKTDGTLWYAGVTYHGNGGDGRNANSPDGWKISSPTQVPGTTWTNQVNDTQAAVQAIKSDGTYWVWGQDSGGCLGLSHVNGIYKYSSPVQLGSGTDWKTVSRGGNAGEAYGIKTDGTLYAWGANNKGQLGLNQGPAQLTGASSPIQIPGTTWANICIGEASAIATKTDGTLWTWGDNNYGQLGQNSVNDPRSSPVQIPGTNWNTLQIVANQNGFVALKTDGTAWVWGRNADGQLGQNSTTNYSSPIQIPGTDWNGVGGGSHKGFALTKST
tara:strand:+ start:14 stop:1240 length:1227 start_codon:yes stop_codon:yes gene_type:complete